MRSTSALTCAAMSAIIATGPVCSNGPSRSNSLRHRAGCQRQNPVATFTTVATMFLSRPNRYKQPGTAVSRRGCRRRRVGRVTVATRDDAAGVTLTAHASRAIPDGDSGFTESSWHRGFTDLDRGRRWCAGPAAAAPRQWRAKAPNRGSLGSRPVETPLAAADCRAGHIACTSVRNAAMDWSSISDPQLRSGTAAAGAGNGDASICRRAIGKWSNAAWWRRPTGKPDQLTRAPARA